VTTSPWRARRCTGDGGLAGVEVLPFGLLVFVVGSLLVANAWAVVDAKLAVGVAARESVRAYVEAPSAGEARASAVAVGQQVIDEHGRNRHRLGLAVGHEADQPWGRCVRVTVTASYPVPALTLPWIGGFGDGLVARSSHSERIDPYRAGLPAGGRC
jgi:hypothetical protein